MIWFYFGVIALAIILSAIRFIKGPTTSDRVVALDTLTTISTSLLVLLGLFFGRFIYIDVALIYGVLGFVGVLTVARYLEGGL
ncbi:MAG TPA: cation:proton antiporter [Caldithrix abyssi]|uniref:Cation:proton antiporter n=1 Tax=Caldithrix abyssi TaxID=187145 RepID=A0A7V5PMY5_CALAY|nr:cation:proton antiporter [Caldithrix abyssi]